MSQNRHKRVTSGISSPTTGPLVRLVLVATKRMMLVK